MRAAMAWEPTQPMLIERSLMPQFLSNTYLVGTPGAEAVFIDAGGPIAPLVATAERQGGTPPPRLLPPPPPRHRPPLRAPPAARPPLTPPAPPPQGGRPPGGGGPPTP